jgi:hypothetical protein
MSDSKTLTEVVGRTPCRCNAGEVSVARAEDGRPCVLHTQPACKEFLEIDDPADFLLWLRTGERRDNN